MYTHVTPRMSVAIIVPKLPPLIDGLGDYTHHLIQHSSVLDKAILLVAENSEQSQLYFRKNLVLEIPSDSCHFNSLLQSYEIDVLVLQYSAFGFSKNGSPINLLRNIRKWKHLNPKSQLLIMIHELWYDTNLTKPGFYIQLIHKYFLLSCLRTADYIFTSTNGYKETVVKCIKSKNVEALTVGSNILPTRIPSIEQKIPNSWILFGRQTNRLSCLRDFGIWIKKLYEVGLLAQLNIVGPRDNTSMTVQEDLLLQSLLPSDEYVQHGPLSGSILSELLLSSSYGMFSQTPLSYQKSTIFMAYAAHSVEVVVPTEWPPSVIHSGIISTPSSLIRDAELGNKSRRNGFKLGEWYNDHCSWHILANEYDKRLQAALMSSC